MSVYANEVADLLRQNDIRITDGNLCLFPLGLLVKAVHMIDGTAVEDWPSEANLYDYMLSKLTATG